MLKNKDENKEINAEHFPLDLKVGLTTEQVNERVQAGLINKTKKQVSKSYFRIFYENVANFFNILLFIITIAMIVAGLPIQRFVFVTVFMLNIIIGLYQDIRARKLIDKLKVVSSIKVDVLRNGQVEQVQPNELVYSDIVVIKPGTQLVCDGEVVQGNVEMNESLLTGEAVSIAKQIGDPVYSGSFVAAGNAYYRIDHLGKDNYAEKLQLNAKKFKRTKSEILSSIKKIFKVIGFFVIILGFIQILIHWNNFKVFRSVEYKASVDSIASSLITMLPTGMYLLTSLTLAVGVIRLANKRMLTQDMYCIETLARVDTLCLDKTGTLTDGQLSVLKTVSTSNQSEAELAKIIKTLVENTKDENSTGKAIKEKFLNIEPLPAHSAIPFNSERKYSAVMLADGRSIVMGAREFIPHKNKEIDEMCREYEKSGMRVLAIAQYNHVIDKDEKLKETNLIGFIVLQDHVRDDAPANIKWFKESGVDIRIITGDNPESAAEIARRAGIEGAEKFVSLDGKTIEEVKEIAKDYVIFGRVTPEQKQAIIESLKESGRTVAMTGDGVNDILALRVADCSIAMASGSDAAKNVSHLVSLDSSFSSLPDVVREGRRVINNLQRTSTLFLVKTVFAIVITILFLTTMFNPANSYPFNTNNMYLWEWLCIGLGGLFLSFQPNNEQIKSSFLANILFKVVPAAIIQIGLVVFFFVFYKDISLATAASVVAVSIFSLIYFIRTCLPFDPYRAVLSGGLVIIEAILLILDRFAIEKDVFEIKYNLIDGSVILAITIALLVGTILYFGLSIGASKLHKLFDKKSEEKNESF